MSGAGVGYQHNPTDSGVFRQFHRYPRILVAGGVNLSTLAGEDVGVGVGMIPLAGGGTIDDTAFGDQLAGECLKLPDGAVEVGTFRGYQFAHRLESCCIAGLLRGQNDAGKRLDAGFCINVSAAADGVGHDAQHAGFTALIHLLHEVVAAFHGVGEVVRTGGGTSQHGFEDAALVIQVAVLGCFIQERHLAFQQLLHLPSFRTALADVVPEQHKGLLELFGRSAVLLQVVIHMVAQELRSAFSIDRYHERADALVELFPGGCPGLGAGEQLSMFAEGLVVARLGSLCLQVQLNSLGILALAGANLCQRTVGIRKAGGILLPGRLQLGEHVQGGIAPVIQPGAPMQPAFPGNRIAGRPLAIDPDHIGTVRRFTHGEAGHTVGAGGGSPEVRQSTAHAAYFLGVLVVLADVEPLKGSSIGAAVDAVTVHIVEDIAAPPAAAGVLVIGEVHIVQGPGEAFRGAGAVVALPAAGHAAQPERHGVELRVQTALAPVPYKIFGALAGIVNRPAEAGIFQRCGGGNIAGNPVIRQHARVAFHHIGLHVEHAAGHAAFARIDHFANPAQVIGHEADETRGTRALHDIGQAHGLCQLSLKGGNLALQLADEVLVAFHGRTSQFRQFLLKFFDLLAAVADFLFDILAVVVISGGRADFCLGQLPVGQQQAVVRRSQESFDRSLILPFQPGENLLAELVAQGGGVLPVFAGGELGQAAGLFRHPGSRSNGGWLLGVGIQTTGQEQRRCQVGVFHND